VAGTAQLELQVVECGKDKVRNPTLSTKAAERMGYPLKAPASESGRYRQTSAPLKNAGVRCPRKPQCERRRNTTADSSLRRPTRSQEVNAEEKAGLLRSE
jgi:hypothetical protein